MRRIALRASTATSLGAVVLLASVIVAPARAGGDAPLVSRVVVPLAVTVYDPCTAEVVALAGTINFEALATVIDNGQIELQFKTQVTDVAGSGLSTGSPYRLVGEAHGVTTDSTDRAVTAADFALIATPSPGVEIGHAEAKPATTIVLHVTLSEDGLVERVDAESVFVEQRCT
jgi:hypothetical protein